MPIGFGQQRTNHTLGHELAQGHAILANHKKGSFGRWVRAEFDISRQTAYNYMYAYEFLLNHPEVMSNNLTLSDTAIYLIAAPETPQIVVGKVLLEAKKRRVGVAEVKELIKNAANGGGDETASEREYPAGLSADVIEMLDEGKVKASDEQLVALATRTRKSPSWTLLSRCATATRRCTRPLQRASR